MRPTNERHKLNTTQPSGDYKLRKSSNSITNTSRHINKAAFIHLRADFHKYLHTI